MAVKDSISDDDHTENKAYRLTCLRQCLLCMIKSIVFKETKQWIFDYMIVIMNLLLEIKCCCIITFYHLFVCHQFSHMFECLLIRTFQRKL